MNNRNFKPWAPLWAVFALIGLVYQSYNLVQARHTAAWPSVDGQVVSSTIEEYQSKGAKWRVHVNYTYSVGDQSFSGDRVGWFGSTSSFNDPDRAAGFAAPYRDGAKVKVHYDPADAQQAVLVTGSPDDQNIFEWVWLALFVTMAGISWKYWQSS